MGSSDVSSFYPNIDVEVAAEEAKQEIMESDIEIEGLDVTEVALFLACSMTQEEINHEGLEKVVHRRRFQRGSRPGLTCQAITGGEVARAKDECWLPPRRRPGCRQRRRMVGCLVKAAVRLVMKNHYYSLDNIIRKQNKGGAIGNSLTEKLGKLFMKRFNRKFKEKLIKLEIKTELVENYVDDVTEALVSLDPGVRYDEAKKKMVKRHNLVEEDKEKEDDIRTMEELRKIANTIYDCMQFTTDFPSIHQEGKVHVLDLQLFINEDGPIKYEFYEKPCTSKFVIPESSAHSKKMKMSVLVEEGVRRMRNCSRGLDFEVRKNVMESWARKMKRSGYPATTRHQVIREAVEKWEKMCKVEDEGGRPVHRPRVFQLAARRLEKERKGVSWHQDKANQVSAPLIINPTAGGLTGVLKEACTRYEAATGIQVKVIERAGRKVSGDCKAEPLRSENCGREDCLCCKSGKPGKCEKNFVGYSISCESCLLAGSSAQYIGESGRNAYSRGLEHQEDLRNEKEDSPLCKHCTLVHDGEKPHFTMKVEKCFSSCLERQVNEAVQITCSKAEHILNSRSEFH